MEERFKMFKMFKIVSQTLGFITLLLTLTACTGTGPVEKGEGVKIIGTVTYDRVPVKVDNFGSASLDYPKTYAGTGKYLLIKALDDKNQMLAQTTTNAKGEYTLYVPENTLVKIRVYARMFKEDVWDLSVVDNTKQKSNYVLEGQLHTSGTQTSKRDLHAASGWDGQSYSQPRDAAPFAILDSINTIMQKVVQANPDVKFPHLLINWSVNNVSVSGDPSLGHIGTSSYTAHDGNMWILGDANADTDEYDDHIIIHEWAHFFEDKFSRSDSIGGAHSSGDALDIRVAFGEGFGNAMSAIATDNPIYFDTSGPNQAVGWHMNVETAQPENPGWFSEASIQRILYDLYDDNSHSHSDGDHAHLGFKPIYNAMIGKERNAKAFTSIFTFIHALKEENPSSKNVIDQIVAKEKINTIHDVYGNFRSNTINGFYTENLYRNLKVGDWITQCNQNNYGVYNKLGNRTFIKINVPSDGIYTFSAKPSSSSYGDPDLVLYETKYPYEVKGMSPLEGQSSDELTMNLNSGDYMLEVYDNSFQNSCFTIHFDTGSGNLGMSKVSKSTGMSKPTFNNHRRPERRPIQ